MPDFQVMVEMVEEFIPAPFPTRTETGWDWANESTNSIVHGFSSDTTVTAPEAEEQVVSIPADAVDHLVPLGQAMANATAGDFKGIAFSCPVAVDVEFLDDSPSVLGTVTVNAGELKSWVLGEPAPSWLPLNAGDIHELRITRNTPGGGAQDLTLSMFSETVAAVVPVPVNTLLTNLVAYFNMEANASSGFGYYEVDDSVGSFLLYGFDVVEVPALRGGNGADVTLDTFTYLELDTFGPTLRSLLGDDNTSYSFWVKLEAVGEIFEQLLSYSDFSSFANTGFIRIDHNGAAFEANIEWMNGAGDGAQTWTVSLPDLSADGGWYNIVMTRDGADNLKFHVNDVHQGTATLTCTTHANAGHSLILGRGVVGVVDEFGVWSEVLSDAPGDDVEDLFNSRFGLIYSDLTL